MNTAKSIIEGTIVHGDGIGKTLGYPTANLDVTPDETPYKSGVYAAHAEMKGVKYPAALVINVMQKKVEVHLLAYSGGDCYGERMSVEPIQKVAEIEKYDSMEELKEKIKNDIEMVEKIFAVE